MFLADALREGPVAAVVEPLAGYLHVLPRLLGAVASVLPLRTAAAVFAGGSALIVAVLSVYVFVASRRIVPAVWARAALAALYVLLPATAVESANTAANLHFYLPLPVLLALLDRPASPWRAAVPAAIVVVSALSDPRLALLAPVAAVVVWKGPGRPERLVSAAFVGALAVQAVVVLGSRLLDWDPTVTQYPVRIDDSTALDVPRLYGLRVVGPLLVGERLLDNVWRAFGWSFAVVALVVAVAVAVGVAAGMGRGDDRRWMLALFGLSALFFTTHAVLWGTAHLWPHDDFYLAGNRYVQSPMLFLVAGVFVALGARTANAGRIHRAGRNTVLALLGVLVVVNFRTVVWRSDGPSWKGELAAARAACGTDRDGSVRVVIAPRLPGPANWSVPVDCDDLTP